MGVPWRYLLALLVVLPLGAFVVGSLVSASNDEPPARTPIVLREDDSSSTPRPTPTARPTDPASGDDDPEPDDDGQVVRPTPVEDDDDRDEDRDDDGDDGDDDGEDEDD